MNPFMPGDLSSSARERGFSLVELMVVLLVLAILMGVGIVSYARMTQIADDKGAQLDLLTAVKVEALQHLEAGAFSSDENVLLELEPTLRFSDDGDPPGSSSPRRRPYRDRCLSLRADEKRRLVRHVPLSVYRRTLRRVCPRGVHPGQRCQLVAGIVARLSTLPDRSTKSFPVSSSPCPVSSPRWLQAPLQRQCEGPPRPR